MANSDLRMKTNRIVRNETVQFKVKRSLLPDLQALQANGDLHGHGARPGPIQTEADVDFVLLAKRKRHHLQNGFRPNNDDKRPNADDFEMARRAYLTQLQMTYMLDISQIDMASEKNDDISTYYLIRASFAHLGLMAQLMVFQWQLDDSHMTGLSSDLPPVPSTDSEGQKVSNRLKRQVPFDTNAPTSVKAKRMEVYKSFYFFKRHQLRYEDYKNCRERSDFSDVDRFTLVYHLLAGAAVTIPKLPTQKDPDAHGTVDISLMQALSKGIFDDWLVLHEPFTPIPQHISSVPDAEKICCSCTCCYPYCLTCTGQVGPSGTKNPICRVWRRFWYRNCLASGDVSLKSGEKVRDYLVRIATLRNALSFKRFQGAVEEESLVKLYHLMPLASLRSYFGDKIGFYFAWLDFFMYSLSFPAVVGFAFFIVALVYYAIVIGIFKQTTNEQIINNFNSTDDETSAGFDAIGLATEVLSKSCDNYATPVFAAVMLFWGTAFSELWHRRSRWYAFLWHVENVEATEFERPYHLHWKWLKFFRKSRYGLRYALFIPSLVITLFFCSMVFASVYFVNVISIFSFPYCVPAEPILTANGTTNMTTTTTTTTTSTTISSSESGKETLSTEDALICTSFDIVRVVINSISIMILDFLYNQIVYFLTDIESHATQTEYNDALIVKLFAFRFVNSYSILFYVAFAVAPQLVVYPSDVVGSLSPEQKQVLYGCNGNSNCMALLTKQLLGCLVTKPLVRSFLDIIIPRVFFLLRLALGKGVGSSSMVSTNEEEEDMAPTSLTNMINSVPDVITKERTVHRLKTKSNKVGSADQDFQSESPTVRGGQLPPLRKQPTNENMTGSETPKSTESESLLLDKLGRRLGLQKQMPPLSTLDRQEFTVSEYMERVIMYGALLMFSVALPPAPLIALIIIRLDCFLDISRMISDYRRPLPQRAQDIGIWEKIVNFLTYCGILTNPLIVILTSSWGARLSMTEQFWTFLLFEHGMFFIRILGTGLINEEPPQLAKAKLAHKKAKYDLVLSLNDMQQSSSNHRRQSTSYIVEDRLQ